MRSSILTIALVCASLSACNGSKPTPPPSPLPPPPAPKAELALKQISPGSADRAIIFVHGLDGDPESTFKATGAPSWPELMGQDSRPFVGVDPPPPPSAYATYALDYRQVYRSEGNIAEGAQLIADYLIADGVFERHNHVWFITHSLGGMLMKRVLTIYDSPDYQRALRRVVGVFFLGVPSNGSVLAELPENDKARLLLELFGKNYRMIKDLRPEAAGAFLLVLEHDWNRLLSARTMDAPPYVHCAYELNPQFGLVRIVPRLFAQGCLDSASLPMAETHISMAKPTSVKSANYLWARKNIGDDAYQLRRWGAVYREPLGETLGEMIGDFQAAHAEPPDRSGVLAVSESVRYADAPSESTATKLLLKRGTYLAPTVARFLENVAARNTCVSTLVSADQRDVVVTIKGRTQSCGRAGGSERVVCAGTSCTR